MTGVAAEQQVASGSRAERTLHQAHEPPGVAAFFVSQHALQCGLKQSILALLGRFGFEPLLTIELDEEKRRLAARMNDGASRKAGERSPGDDAPALLAVALDLLPGPLDEEARALNPECDNGRLLGIERLVRKALGEDLPSGLDHALLTSTSNSSQAWEVVRCFAPDREHELRNEVEQRRRAFDTPDSEFEITRNGNRARVHVVRFNGELAVQKTFRPNALHFMQREIEVLEALAPSRPEFPKLLAKGPNYIIVEHVGTGRTPASCIRPAPLPLWCVRQLADLIRFCVSKGFDPVDLMPSNNVIIQPGAIRVIDFEFWRPCDPTILPEQSLCLAGVPHGEQGIPNAYPKRWAQYTCLPLKSFLHDPAWLQRLKRPIHFSRLFALWLAGALARRLPRLSGQNEHTGRRIPRHSR